MKRFVLWTTGLVLGIWVTRELQQGARRLAQKVVRLDLNLCSREDLLKIPELSASMADRIIANRPYRHRLDLVARMVIPGGIYQEIRDRIDASGKAVHVAS